MHFELNHLIWSFWLIPILFIVALSFEKRRRGILHAIYPPEVISQRIPLYSRFGPLLRHIFFLTALIFFGIALLKPYSDFETREVKRKGVNLYFLVDLSQSMMAQDVSPSRLMRARREIADFVKQLTGDRVGLIGFAGSSFVFVPLTTDYNAFDLFVEDLSTDLIPVQGTDIAGALQKAVDSFGRQVQNSSKAIVLITDGEDSVGLDPKMIESIKSQGVKVFVMAVGTAEGAPVPLAEGGYKTDREGKVVISKLNEAALQQLATATGGGYVRSVTGDLDLEQIYFGGIKRAFADEDMAVAEKKIPHYQFQIFILIGLIFVMLEILTTHRKSRLWKIFKKKKLESVAVIVLVLSTLFRVPQVEAYNPFLFESANKDYQSQDYIASIEKYQELIKKDPESPELWFNLANAYYRAQKFKEAEDAYNKALTSADLDLQKKIFYNKGDAQYRQNNLKGALDSFDKALKVDPQSQEAKLNYDFVKKKLEEQEKQKQQQQEQKDKEDQQDQEEQKKDQQQADQQKQDQQEQKDKEQQQSQQNQQNQDQQNNQNKGDQQVAPTDDKNKEFQYDANPQKLLENISDNPQDAMKKMIQNQQVQQKKIEKDW